MKVILYIALVVCFFFIGEKSIAQTFVIPDAHFKACLINKAPAAFDTNGDLLLAEAPNVAGSLSCIGDTISQVDGLEYFTGLSEINLSRNTISSINVLPASDSLTRLVLDDNALLALPSLSALSKLKILSVRRNRLATLTDLSSNTTLTQLYVDGNNLSTLPALSSLEQLWAVNFSDNQLTQLPLLDSLQKLEELVVRNNQLTQIQSLERLDSLKVLNLERNKLTALPAVSPSNNLEVINIRGNLFSDLPDFSVYPKLVSANLNDNYFTFEDLFPLTGIPDYLTKFPLIRQKKIAIGQSFEIRRLDTLYLQTAVDTAVAGVNYEWYYQGGAVRSSNVDSIRVFNETTSQTGHYYCQLTHLAFAGLVLQTDSFYVQVNPCFQQQEIRVEVLPRTCKNNGGQVLVSTPTPMPIAFMYQLVASRTGEERYASDGVFYDLGETEYRLYGEIGACREAIGDPIEIAEEACENVYITVDGDGDNDVYYINETGTAKVYDKFGNALGEIQLPGYWDGYYQGQKVAPGLYFIEINDLEKVIKITVVH